MHSYRSIVVNTDGTSRSIRTVEIAARLARRDCAGLTVARAYRRTPPAGGFAADALGADAFSASPVAGAEFFLHDIVANPELGGADLMLRSVPGEPAGALLSIADDVHADLIVVGEHDFHNPRWARWFESFPAAVLRRSHSDVLIVRERQTRGCPGA